MAVGQQDLLDANFQDLSIAVATQGDTGTASAITITAKNLAGDALGISGNLVRVRICDDGVFTDATNATIAAAGGSSAVETITATKDLVLSNITAASASGTLTISGVVIDGETATIGGRTYEFDTDGSVTSGNVQVDLSASATASQGTLSLDTQVTADDTMTIGGRTYAFVTDGNSDHDGEINIGSDLADGITDIIAAINGTDSVNTANASVTAAAGDPTNATATLTVSDAFSDGETVTIGTKTYTMKTALTPTEGEVLIGASAAASLDNLKSAVNLEGTPDVDYKCAAAHPEVTATDNGDTTQKFEATISGSTGSAGNALDSTETCSNAAFGAAAFAGGLDNIVLTAIVPGTAGDAIGTTEAFTATNNQFDSTSLGTTTAGVDCPAAAAVTALVAAITGDSSAVVSAADGAGDTVVLTAATAGSAANSYGTTEAMANGAFGAATLAGGYDESLSEFKFALTDATAETVTVRIGPAPVGSIFGDYSATLDVTHEEAE